MAVNFNITREERDVILKIAQRAISVALEAGIQYGQLEVVMDVTAVHANGCPLKLTELLEADDFNFNHDIFGIRNCLNRKTGQLERCFLPRFAQ